MAQIGNVEVYLTNGGYGGDFILADNGDLLLAEDTVLDPEATLQRVMRLILTNAKIIDADGTPISEADDIFNDWYGSSIRALIGQMITPALLAGIKARILQALTTDPGLVQSPAPSISVVAGPNASIIISGSVTLVTGNTAPLPTIVVPVNGTPTILPAAA
jgi:hypothetical protein